MSQCATMVLVAEVLTLNSIPFHAILVRNLTKRVLNNGSQGSVVQMVMIDLSAEVELSLGLELVVQALATHKSGS